MKIPYYVVVKGRGYWQPTRKMRSLGFQTVRCGPDGPAAWKIASEWNARWQAARRGLAPLPVAGADGHLSPEMSEEMTFYPPGSLGEAFRRYRQTDEWRSAKKARTREDWWRGWKRIKPVFGDVDPRTVTLEDMSAWRKAIEESVSLREAHRALKIWRALWKVAAALHYCDRDADPSLAVRNKAAKGRSSTWSEGEVARLAKEAWRQGYRGLAVGLAIMWDSQLSPGDVRALTLRQLSKTATGATFFTQRGKTNAPVGGILSRRTAALLQAYLSSLGVVLHDDAPILRTRGLSEPTAKGGRPRPSVPYTKDTMAADFRAIRAAVFGDGERRQLLDIRRSGAVEAITGGAEAEQLALAMGNTLAASNQLYETYVPPNLTVIRQVHNARREGRRKLRDGNA